MPLRKNDPEPPAPATQPERPTRMTQAQIETQTQQQLAIAKKELLRYEGEVNKARATMLAKQKALKDAGFRVEVDERNEKMNSKIRDFANQKTPYILVFGDKEEAANAVSVRTRGKGDQGSVPLADFIAKAKSLVAGQSTEL